MRAIRCGGAVRPLAPHPRSLADLTYQLGDRRLGVGDYMARRRTAGLLILLGGQVALERYGMGNDPESLWTSFSTAKSMTATLVGAALHDGAIGSLDDPCDLYLPRLLGSAYAGVTIRNVLRMYSGVAWRSRRRRRAKNASHQQIGERSQDGRPTPKHPTSDRPTPPTSRMVAFAERLAKDKRASLPSGYDKDFDICRGFLDQHAGR